MNELIMVAVVVAVLLGLMFILFTGYFWGTNEYRGMFAMFAIGILLIVLGFGGFRDALYFKYKRAIPDLDKIVLEYEYKQSLLELKGE